MRTLIEEHGGAIATAAVVALVIVAIVAIGASGALNGVFSNIWSTFQSKANAAVGW